MGDRLNEQTIALPRPLARRRSPRRKKRGVRAEKPAGSGAKTPRSGPDTTKAIGSAGSTSSAMSCATPPAPGIRPRAARREASPTCCSWAWADRASAPKCWRRAWDRRPAIPSCTCSIPPTRSRYGVSRAASMSRARSSSYPASPARRSNRTCSWIIFLRSASAALGGAAGRTLRRHYRSGHRNCRRQQRTAASATSSSAFPSIGGRYSVLSKFGLVPLAAIGHDVRAFLELAAVMAQACGPETLPAENPGVALGLAIGVLARQRAR